MTTYRYFHTLSLLFFVGISLTSVQGQTKEQLDIFKKQIKVTGKNDQEILKKITTDIFVVVRQDYVLASKASGERYGRGGNAYFGRAYSLGVIADSMIWADAYLKSTWLTDKSYKRFAKVDSLAPVNSMTNFRYLEKSGINKGWLTEKTFETLDPSTSDQFLLYPAAAQLASNGVGTIIKNARKDGWLVVATSKKAFIEDNELQTVELSFYPEKVTAAESYQINRELGEHVLGGFFFTPKYERGTMELLLSGVLSMNEDKRWEVYFLQNYDPLTPTTLTKVSSTNTTTSQGGNNSFLNLIDPNKKKEVGTATITLLNDQNKPISDQKLSLDEDGRESYLTDQEGRVEIPLKKSEQNSIYMNKKEVACVATDDQLTLVCSWKKRKYVPLNQSKCN